MSIPTLGEIVKYEEGATINVADMKIKCLELAINSGSCSPFETAKEYYEWIMNTDDAKTQTHE